MATWPRRESADQTLIVTGAENGSRFRLMDATGKLLLQQTANGSYSDRAYMGGLVAGIYLLNVTATDGTATTIKLHKK